jgi:hypothetical protein
LFTKGYVTTSLKEQVATAIDFVNEKATYERIDGLHTALKDCALVCKCKFVDVHEKVNLLDKMHDPQLMQAVEQFNNID